MVVEPVYLTITKKLNKYKNKKFAQVKKELNEFMWVFVNVGTVSFEMKTRNMNIFFLLVTFDKIEWRKE